MEEDAFKTVFKHFKRKRPPLPNYDTALNPVKNPMDFDSIRSGQLQSEEQQESLGLTPEYEVFALKDGIGGPSGLYILPQILTSEGQLNWSLDCLKDFARNPPYKTNLSTNDGWFEAAKTDAKIADKLRWATLGLHHDWDTKIYDPDQNSRIMPDSLSRLCKTLVNLLPVEYPNFSAEAAIINFYPMDASLGGHTDNSEPNMDAPLVSVSLGQSAIFLIGGKSKSVKPIPLLLQSGDAIIMTGESRRSFHAVPKIIPNPNLKVNQCPMTDDKAFVLKYLEHHRINMNVRQVN